MESLRCETRIGCEEWPRCYNIEVDGNRVCKAIYFAMLNSLPDDFEIIEMPPAEE